MSPVRRTNHVRSEVVVELTKAEIINMVKQYYFETVPADALIYNNDRAIDGLTEDTALITFSWTEVK